MSGGVERTPPILSDGNTVAWFDKEVNITKDGSNFVSVWGDKSGLSHDLLQAVGTNQPLWSATGVAFNGSDNNMKCVAFTLIQPEQIYMVLRQRAWANLDRIFDGDSAAVGLLSQKGTTPDLIAYAGVESSANSNLTLNTFGIIRVLFNGAASKLIINETTPTTGNFGTEAMGGFTLASIATGSGYCNIEVKEIIIRKVADTTPDEAAIYNYLKSKYGL